MTDTRVSELSQSGLLTSVRRLFAFFEDKTRNRVTTVIRKYAGPR